MVDLPTGKLQVYDELAVFDGDVCVGTVTITEHNLNKKTIPIFASAGDETGMTGFEEGHKFRLKL